MDGTLSNKWRIYTPLCGCHYPNHLKQKINNMDTLEKRRNWDCKQCLEDIRTHSTHEFWSGGTVYIYSNGERLYRFLKDFGGVWRYSEIKNADIRLYNPIEKHEFASVVQDSYLDLLNELVLEV